MPANSESKSGQHEERTERPKQLTFHFIKSNAFRVLHIDGAFGGVGPTADSIHMAIFSHRQPIPVQVAYAINEDGKLGDEIDRVVREGLVREVEADLVMSVDTAATIRDWLDERIEQVKKLSKSGKRK